MNTTESQISNKMGTSKVSDGSTDCEEIEEDVLATQYITTLSGEEIKQQAKVQQTDDDDTSHRFTDCNNVHITPTKITPTVQEKKIHVDNDVTDYKFTEISTKTLPEGELDLVDMENQITVKSESIDDHYNNATSDINRDQSELANSSLVTSNEVNEVELWSVDDKVKNRKDESQNTYCVKDLDSQEKNDVIGTSDSSDAESTPKKPKYFTYTDSDFPDSDEIHEILMSYPKPAVSESNSDSELESSSGDESYFTFRRRRRRNPFEHAIKVDLNQMIGLEKLPEKFITRQRRPNLNLLTADEASKKQSARMFKSSYLKNQEVEINEEMIHQNIKRLKLLKIAQNLKDLVINKKENKPRESTDNENNKHKKKIKRLKVKINKPQTQKSAKPEKKITKGHSLDCAPAAKTTTRMTRSIKTENDGKNDQNKRILPGNKKHQNKGTRSNRRQKAKEKNGDTMEAPKSIQKKRLHGQRTAYNISSSSPETPKSLKRSLVDDNEVPSPKRSRSPNATNNRGINNVSLRTTPARIKKTQNVLLTALPSREVKLEKLGSGAIKQEPAQKRYTTLNSQISLLNMKTRSQSSYRRSHRACKQSTKPAKTSNRRP